MTSQIKNKILLDALNCKAVERPPIWLLRQAGRYQEEYRKLRKTESNFLNFCKNPELTTAAAMIPINNYNLDASILFSDILTTPEALGMDLSFKDQIGPVFSNPISKAADIDSLDTDNCRQKLEYVATAVKTLKKELCNKIPLIGFCGSPWTLATYMIEGQSSKTHSKLKSFVFNNPALTHSLLEKLATSLTEQLELQIEAGADVVMIFDSWGGILSLPHYEEFSLNYIKEIIKNIKHKYKVPVIVFTKGGNAWLPQISRSGCDAISIDWTLPLAAARESIPSNIAIQGNLDPSILYGDYAYIEKNVLELLGQHAKIPGYIFNLGHGIPKDVDPKKVKFLADLILNFK
ncbi:MAG: uroporphyrinogen decarboxylase [Legionellales bacterium]|nr:uroporphyrinogen decarboxylase [Legionellales bacterium]